MLQHAVLDVLFSIHTHRGCHPQLWLPAANLPSYHSQAHQNALALETFPVSEMFSIGLQVFPQKSVTWEDFSSCRSPRSSSDTPSPLSRDFLCQYLWLHLCLSNKRQDPRMHECGVSPLWFLYHIQVIFVQSVSCAAYFPNDMDRDSEEWSTSQLPVPYREPFSLQKVNKSYLSPNSSILESVLSKDFLYKHSRLRYHAPLQDSY